MSNKNLDEIFEKEDKKEYIKDDITLTETKETVTKRKRQPVKKKIHADFEKEKDEFMKSLLSKSESEPEKKEVKPTLDTNERKLKLIENLKKAREQKKANKQQSQQPQQPPSQPPQAKEEVKKEQPKPKQEEVDPEYLEWKKQKQVKVEPKPEIKQEQKVEPKPEIKQQEPKKEYIKICAFKKPLWG
jgi:FK506-binding nuclear protein